MSRIALRAVCVLSGMLLLVLLAESPPALAQRGGLGGGMGGGGGAALGSSKREIKSPARWANSAASDAETKIRAQLDLPTTMDFVETPLQDAVDYLKDHHGIEIQLDSKALEDGGMGTDTPISRKLAGIPLRSALQLLLDPIGLIFVVRDEVLLITTPEAADKMIELRIYRVGDLGQTDEELNEMAAFLRPLLGGDIELRAHRKLLFARAPTPIQEELSRALTDLRGKINSP